MIRHASAADKERDQKDIDRFLTADGVQEATRTGHYFNKEGVQPDIIITSPANRARGTATLIAEQIKYNTDLIHINEELYEASVRTLLQVVNRLKEEWNEVFIIGHNPSISYLAEYITHAEIGSISPSGFVHVKVNSEKWTSISEATESLQVYRDPSTYDF